jgi:hypothetical protein
VRLLEIDMRAVYGTLEEKGLPPDGEGEECQEEERSGW